MFSKRVCRALHDEHRATIELSERLAGLLDRYRRGPPDVADALTARLLRDIPPAMDTEVSRHFAFEEAELFSHLAAVGDTAIGAHLTDEHETIRPLGSELSALARAAAVSGFDGPRWQAFRTVAGELCQRLLEHVQKEEMVLLPLLEEDLDDATDARLHDAYVANT
jgi:hemerythrin-like domain-containing protein